VLPGYQAASQAFIDVDASVLPAGVYALTLRTTRGLEVHRDEAVVILPRPAISSLGEKPGKQHLRQREIARITSR
jgi:hypothetical protein